MLKLNSTALTGGNLMREVSMSKTNHRDEVAQRPSSGFPSDRVWNGTRRNVGFVHNSNQPSPPPPIRCYHLLTPPHPKPFVCPDLAKAHYDRHCDPDPHVVCVDKIQLELLAKAGVKGVFGGFPFSKVI